MSILGEAEHQAHLFQGLVKASGAETRSRHLLPCGVSTCFQPPKTSLVAQTVKRLPTMQETRVQSLGGGRSSGEGNVNPLQCSCLEKSHGRRSLVSYSPWGRKESDTTELLHFTSLHFTSLPASQCSTSWEARPASALCLPFPF